jgi:hypothetical protein
MPAPALVNPPVPLTAEAKVTLLPLVSNVPPPDPSAASHVEMSAVLPVAHCRPPPFNVIWPLPKLLAAVKLTKPPVTVVPPE